MNLISREACVTRSYIRGGKGSRMDEGLLADLLAKIAEHDQRAFKQLYDLTARRLFAVVCNILRQNSEAEDALQEAFLRIWRHAGSYAVDRGAPMAWMHIVARNAALDFGQKRWATVEVVVLDALEFSTPPQDPPDIKLARCLRKLPAEQANAIVLMYTYGLSHEELARLLKTPLGTVKSWIKRGTQQLREDILH